MSTRTLQMGMGLTEKQKVETITTLCTLYSTQSMGDSARLQDLKWHRFRAELEELYPDIAARACTRQELSSLSNSQQSLAFGTKMMS